MTSKTSTTTQAAALVGLASKTLAEAQAEAELRTFRSGNEGVYISKTLKGVAAREQGINVPPGGKVKVQITLIVVDPENSQV